jgi:hypothetical protein
MKKFRIRYVIKSHIRPRLKSIAPGLLAFLQHVGRRYATWRRRRLKPEQYPRAIKQWYFRAVGRPVDLENPKTFGEKIQWMKLHDSTPLKTELADKYKVRKWITEKIGDEYLVPLLGKWKNADDIDFDALPDQFVLKANHGAGWNIIVKDKRELNIARARRKLNGWLKQTIAFDAFELHYKDIPPLIVAEKYIENMDGDVYDYKFYCFNGEPKYCLVIIGRRADRAQSVVDMNFQLAPFQIGTYPGIDFQTARPANFDQMVSLAKTLCEGFTYVRVDFYNIAGKICFGEMTFTPAGGTGNIRPSEYQRILGDMIPVP